MIKFGSFEIDFFGEEDWEYSASGYDFKEVTFQIKSDRFNYKNSVSFESNDSPLRLIRELRDENIPKIGWQSLCQELRVLVEKKGDEINFEIYLEDDSDEK